jgi:hypothetical protein
MRPHLPFITGSGHFSSGFSFFHLHRLDRRPGFGSGKRTGRAAIHAVAELLDGPALEKAYPHWQQLDQFWNS